MLRDPSVVTPLARDELSLPAVLWLSRAALQTPQGLLNRERSRCWLRLGLSRQRMAVHPGAGLPPSYEHPAGLESVRNSVAPMPEWHLASEGKPQALPPHTTKFLCCSMYSCSSPVNTCSMIRRHLD